MEIEETFGGWVATHKHTCGHTSKMFYGIRAVAERADEDEAERPCLQCRIKAESPQLKAMKERHSKESQT